jgi:hypothetical protein
MKPELIAPCGINCATCIAYFGYTMSGAKRKITCSSCRTSNKGCAFLKDHCRLLAKNEVAYCSDCNDFPCQHLVRLDRRYRKNYNMSVVENLNFIRDHGMKKFVDDQSEKYRCPECGGTICVHTSRCYNCSVTEKTR